MDCFFHRETISARLDGEASALESAALDAHLAGCPGCRAWADAAQRVTRAARVEPADRVPYLTVVIMSSLANQVDKLPRTAPADGASPVGTVSLGLFMVAVLQLCTAMPDRKTRELSGRPRRLLKLVDVGLTAAR